MSRRTFAIAFLAVALLLAGVGSYYASTSPDGLERVAEQTGFADSAEESATSESPLADYETAGVDDKLLGGGLAGVLGALVVLLLAGGLAFGLRRRPGDAAESAGVATDPADADDPADSGERA